jgi:hypothetical protein
MKIGDILVVESNWSITKDVSEVEVLEINRNDLTIFVKYPGGYSEWLPIAAFRGY